MVSIEYYDDRMNLIDSLKCPREYLTSEFILDSIISIERIASKQLTEEVGRRLKVIRSGAIGIIVLGLKYIDHMITLTNKGGKNI